MGRLQQFLEVVKRLVAPQDSSCHICDRLLLQTEHYLCEDCCKGLDKCRIPFPQNRRLLNRNTVEAISVFWYQDEARSLVIGLKYGHDLVLAKILGLVAAETLASQPKVDLKDLEVVPVPTHPRRTAERGYNQAEEIAREMCSALGLPLHSHLLKRNRYEKTQVRRTRSQRQAAMKDAFSATEDLTGKRILLVDDVLTTGSTLTACARALYQAGAAEVMALAICND